MRDTISCLAEIWIYHLINSSLTYPIRRGRERKLA